MAYYRDLIFLMHENFEGVMSFLLGILGAVIVYAAVSKAMGEHGGEKRLTEHFKVSDFLKSSTFPRLKDYQLSKGEYQNLKRLASLLEILRAAFGPFRITSGGRPQAVGDFVSALRKRGYRAIDNSQHNDFAAVDFTYGSPAKDYEVYIWALRQGLFLQLILTLENKARPDGSEYVMSYIHASVPDPNRPGLKPYRAIDSRPPEILEALKNSRA